jgi:hypothetical protein
MKFQNNFMRKMARKSQIRIITILYLFAFSPIAIGQNNITDCSNLGIDSTIFEQNLVGEFAVRLESNKANTFYNSDWRLSTVILENNKNVANKYLNYNQLSGQFYWIRLPDYKQIILKKETIKEIDIFPKENDKKEVFRKIKFQPWYSFTFTTEYLQVLSEGKINLYAFRRAETNVSSNEIVPFSEYYIQINNNYLKHLKRGRWALYASVGADKILMKKVVRSNHLKIRDETDLIKAIDLFNQEAKKTRN